MLGFHPSWCHFNCCDLQQQLVLPSADGPECPESDADVDHDDVRKSNCSILLPFVHALATLTCDGRVQLRLRRCDTGK